MAKSLVIVESPAKASTINKILGKKYLVTSSMGHIMDLPKSKMGIDIEKGFTPEYVVIPGKKKMIDALKKEATDADSIFLATDPDREGEAISWHLASIFNKKKKIYRIAFHEITKSAIEAAIANPGKIDMDMVDAQQTRRVLDRLVGYSISPLLWRKVGKGLSAGRVQSVAVRLIVDREKEISVFVPDEYWDVEAELKKKEQNSISFTARLDKIDDKKADLKNNNDSVKIVAELEKEKYTVANVEKKEKRKYASPPFTTSKLQQEAFHKLRFQAIKTMKVAQQLYEGLPIGDEGNVGLITYMRTDSVKVSNESQDIAKKYILEKYGAEFIPSSPNVYKSKKSAQEAHEAIRPALPLREPGSIKDFLTLDQLKLYTLIWNRFISSQMTPAVFNVVGVDIKAGRCIFKANGSQKIFQGFSIVYEENEEVSEKENDKENVLPPLEAGEILDLLKLSPNQHFTKPPPRYSDASLVKALEEDGIGRPSTYAPIIQTIIARNYVKRKEGYFCPSELGVVVTDLLIKSFPKILDMEFTAKMEEELDEIEEGRQKSEEVIKRFYEPFTKDLEHAKLNMRKVKGEAVKTSEICEKCGKPMVIKWGRLGRFLSCSDFPTCRFAKAISTGVKCPEPNCTGTLVERRSKGGRHFYGCSSYPNCHHISRRLPSENGDDKALEGEDV
jgi:DNA topoisomerase I